MNPGLPEFPEQEQLREEEQLRPVEEKPMQVDESRVSGEKLSSILKGYEYNPIFYCNLRPSWCKFDDKLIISDLLLWLNI